MKNLASLSKAELDEFFNSFDQVLCDVDGVLWFQTHEIPGAQEAINLLRMIGKIIIFVSNNSTKGWHFYRNALEAKGFGKGDINLVIPNLAIIDYLKEIKFKKEAFILGTTSFKEELKEAGIKVAEGVPLWIEETVPEIMKQSADDEKIGAVIAGIDVNLNYIALQKAVNCLKRPDVLFISGGGDTKLMVSSHTSFIGPKYFHDILENVTNRKKICLAKPSLNLNDYILKKFHIKDKSRVLFIGDSITVDMTFATNCGYKKLLVLTGHAKQEDVNNWTSDEKIKPHYYVDSIQVIADLLSS